MKYLLKALPTIHTKGSRSIDTKQNEVGTDTLTKDRQTQLQQIAFTITKKQTPWKPPYKETYSAHRLKVN